MGTEIDQAAIQAAASKEGLVIQDQPHEAPSSSTSTASSKAPAGSVLATSQAAAGGSRLGASRPPLCTRQPASLAAAQQSLSRGYADSDGSALVSALGFIKLTEAELESEAAENTNAILDLHSRGGGHGPQQPSLPSKAATFLGVHASSSSSSSSSSSAAAAVTSGEADAAITAAQEEIWALRESTRHRHLPNGNAACVQTKPWHFMAGSGELEVPIALAMLGDQSDHKKVKEDG